MGINQRSLATTASRTNIMPVPAPSPIMSQKDLKKNWSDSASENEYREDQVALNAI